MENNQGQSQPQVSPSQPSQQPQPQSQPQPNVSSNAPQEGMSEDTKTVITVVALLLFYPIGLILVFVWMKWPLWVKILLALPFVFIVLFIIGIMFVGILTAANPRAAVDKANCVRSCEEITVPARKTLCLQECSKKYPASSDK